MNINAKDISTIIKLAYQCNGSFEVEFNEVSHNKVTVEFILGCANEEDPNYQEPYFPTFHELIDREGYLTELDDYNQYKLHIAKEVKLEKEVIAKDIEIVVGEEVKKVNIIRNEKGNLEVTNLGVIAYDMNKSEITFSEYDNAKSWQNVNMKGV